MRLLEDYLTQNDIESIDRVLASANPRFDLLAKIAALDPQNDFTFSDFRKLNMCGADLRGFDFSGSDLRQCVRNSNTLIDETTNFSDALVDWIEVDSLPIVVKMQEVELAASSQKRQKLLNELTAEFGKSTHVVSYLVKAASQSDTLDKFLDFVSFLPDNLSANQLKSLKIIAQKLLKKKISQSRSRTGRDRTAILAVDKIVEKLQLSTDSFGEKIYRYLVEIVNSKRQTVVLKGMVTIEVKDIEDAFNLIGT